MNATTLPATALKKSPPKSAQKATKAPTVRASAEAGKPKLAEKAPSATLPTAPTTKHAPSATLLGPKPGKAKPETAPKPGKAVKSTKPVEPEKSERLRKPKLVRDSFTIPKSEYELLAALKTRAVRLNQPTKKSELLRAGIALLAELGDDGFLAAMRKIPALKTGRPKAEAKVTP